MVLNSELPIFVQHLNLTKTKTMKNKQFLIFLVASVTVYSIIIFKILTETAL